MNGKENKKGRSYHGRLKNLRTSPYLITGFLVGSNALIFLVLSFIGRTEDTTFMLQHGAMYLPNVKEQGEYYRLFTCMFLHFGFEHLMSNMIMLILMAYRLEPAIGRVRFLLVYLGAGLGGNMVSAVYDLTQDHYYVSAGASGAVFGLIGAMLWMVLMNQAGRSIKGYGFLDLSEREMLVLIGLGLYSGFTDSGIDNAAHIGGLIAGFILAAILTIGLFEKKENNYYGYY